VKQLDAIAADVFGPEGLALARGVVCDDGACRVQDRCGRAIVLLELDDRRSGMVALEVEDVPDLGAAKPVDRLVLVTDHADVVVDRRQRLHQQVLRPVRVLVLVDEQMGAAARVALARLGGGVGGEQRQCLEQDVVEVDGIGPQKARFVARVDLGDELRVGRERARLHLRGRLHRVLGAADASQERARRPGGVVDALRAQDPPHERDLVVGVVDREVRIEADRSAIPPEDPQAQAVKRADPRTAGARAEKPFDALAHLARRFVREGDGDDAAGIDALMDQPGDPVGDDARLAGARPREDQQRAARMDDRLPLRGVQRIQ
jgi:hypothetical protein